MNRIGTINRKTAETSIQLAVDLEADFATSKIDTSVAFFDHMLTHIVNHGYFHIDLMARGDTEIDFHHLVEDTGISFGSAMRQALGNFSGINRYGHFLLPMDETLVMVALDLCGRCHLTYEPGNLPEKIGGFDTQLAQEFFRAITFHLPMVLHIKVLSGINGHHILEGIFKGFGRALRMAVTPNPLLQKGSIPSSKGLI